MSRVNATNKTKEARKMANISSANVDLISRMKRKRMREKKKKRKAKKKS